MPVNPTPAEAYPLSWPFGWTRTHPHSRRRARYKVTYGASQQLVVKNLRLLGASGIVCSTNLPVKSDGMPYAAAAERRVDDPGVAVYFTRKGVNQVVACDKWDLVKDNLRAVGLALEAMRQLDRCGASEILNRAFTGFTALPAPEAAASAGAWWDVLDVSQFATLDIVELAYKSKRSAAHPDRPGGSAQQFQAVQAAYEAAKRHLGAL